MFHLLADLDHLNHQPQRFFMSTLRAQIPRGVPH
jgi:hypothetical protein